MKWLRIVVLFLFSIWSISLSISETRAMQNPIYQMVRQVEFYCGEHPVDVEILCSKLSGEIRKKLKLDVTSFATDLPSEDSINTELVGILQIGLVISENGERVRLIWVNPLRISGGELKFEGNWVNLPSNLRNSIAAQETAETLLAVIP